MAAGPIRALDAQATAQSADKVSYEGKGVFRFPNGTERPVKNLTKDGVEIWNPNDPLTNEHRDIIINLLTAAYENLPKEEKAALDNLTSMTVTARPGEQKSNVTLTHKTDAGIDTSNSHKFTYKPFDALNDLFTKIISNNTPPGGAAGASNVSLTLSKVDKRSRSLSQPGSAAERKDAAAAEKPGVLESKRKAASQIRDSQDLAANRSTRHDVRPLNPASSKPVATTGQKISKFFRGVFGNLTLPELRQNCDNLRGQIEAAQGQPAKVKTLKKAEEKAYSAYMKEAEKVLQDARDKLDVAEVACRNAQIDRNTTEVYLNYSDDPKLHGQRYETKNAELKKMFAELKDSGLKIDKQRSGDTKLLLLLQHKQKLITSLNEIGEEIDKEAVKKPGEKFFALQQDWERVKGIASNVNKEISALKALSDAAKAMDSAQELNAFPRYGEEPEEFEQMGSNFYALNPDSGEKAAKLEAVMPKKITVPEKLREEPSEPKLGLLDRIKEALNNAKF